MKPFLLLSVLLAGFLAACSSKAPDQQKLASACQIIKCVCQPTTTGIGNPFVKKPLIDPLWNPDGKAYCPVGHNLEPRDSKSMYDRPLY
jgi:hypothetical protein